jgi:hypothetical protein
MQVSVVVVLPVMNEGTKKMNVEKPAAPPAGKSNGSGNVSTIVADDPAPRTAVAEFVP